MSVGRCRLCDKESCLLHSHILPGFIFRWVRETSANGYLRQGMIPNKRVQDGPKRYWLCESCEGLLNRSETVFAEKLFYPYINETFCIMYQDWLLHFCVSVSWRVLRLHQEETQLENNYGPEAIKHIAQAELTWRSFLLGKLPHPGRFHQHIIPVGAIESMPNPKIDPSPNLNRYLLRTVDTNLCQNQTMILVYSKLPRFVILGFIHNEGPNEWRGTQVRLKQGRIETQRYCVPFAFFEYLNRKAKQEKEIAASISPGQREKSDQSFRKDAERFVGSDAFVAMQHDVEMFDDEAFCQHPTESDAEP